MKISVKLRPEATDSLQFHVPVSLKRDWQNLRAAAEKRGIDFGASAAEMLKQFVVEFTEELTNYNPESSSTTTKKRPGRKPGPQSVTTSTLEDLTPPTANSSPSPMPNGADEGEAD